jgi:AraC family transcriptional regulator
MREISPVGAEQMRRIRDAHATNGRLVPFYNGTGHTAVRDAADGQLGESERPEHSRPHRASVGRLLMAAVDLLEAVESELDGDEKSACEHARRAGTTLGAAQSSEAPVVEAPVQSDRPRHTAAGGLAPWQIRRVATHIETRLHTTITTDELATIARLSPFHFARAFKRSFGDSPHRYVLRRRTERAQGLMLSTDAPLGQIALDCGLADQSHLTRLFQKLVGDSPAAWRRARVRGRP